MRSKQRKAGEDVIRNKAALIFAAVLFAICVYLFFPYPDYQPLNARSTFMSFPIRTSDGYNLLGIAGSLLFLIATGLIVFGLKKYRLRTLVIISIIYAFLPKMLIYSYQETLANGIAAVSLENGSCHFEEASEDLMTGECSLVLKNHSGEDVTFKLEFIDSDWDGNYRAESLMNENGPYTISIEANRQKQIDLKELLDVSEIPNRIHSGSSSYIHIKINDGEKTRIL